jgi:ribosomal protein S18 acetylase RimI-like enzyme
MQNGRVLCAVGAALQVLTSTTSSLVQIRSARPEDAAAIAAVHLASWQSTYAGIISQAYLDALSLEKFVGRWERLLAEAALKSSTILVGVDDAGDVLGFVSGGPARESCPGFDAELYAIYLLPSAERRGLGRRLFQSLVDKLASEQRTGMYVRVLSNNPATTFYERLGGLPLRGGALQIGEASYPETWYGWPSLSQLT